MAAARSRSWRSSLNGSPLLETMGRRNGSGSRTVRSESGDILRIEDGFLFVWDSDARCVRTANLNKDRLLVDSYQTLLPTALPLCEIDTILTNACTSVISLVGKHGAAILELPKRWGKNLDFDHGKERILCKSVLVGERFFVCHSKIRIVQAAWHPGSLLDCHLVALTSDNYLRIFDVSSPEEPQQTLKLGPTPSSHSFSSASGKGSSSILGFLGDTAVGFDFGLPVEPPKKEAGGSGSDPKDVGVDWPVFVLRGNGDVYTVSTSVEPNRTGITPEVHGPLTMHPPAEDNYGVDACSILCLQTVPPIVVVATCGGTLYNCLVLTQGDEEDGVRDASVDGEERYNPTSLSTFQKVALYVYESVELELSLSTVSPSTGEQDDSPYSCPIKLRRDPYSRMRYHCSHSAGVHTVVLPVVPYLEQFLEKIEEDVSGTALSSLQEQACIVEHLLCTKPLNSSPPAPILGLAISPDVKFGAILSCLTSDFEIVTLQLVRGYYELPSKLFSEENDQVVSSPLRRVALEPFELHIRQLLQRDVSHPLLKSSAAKSELGAEEGLQLLSRATQVLREEYIHRQDLAQREIQRRVAILSLLKAQQFKEVDNMESERDQLTAHTQDLAERYEDAREKQTQLVARLESILHRMQLRIPSLSDAEHGMSRELSTIEDHLKTFENALEQVKAKDNYQNRYQQQNEVTTAEQEKVAEAAITNNRQKHLQDILQTQSGTLLDLVNKVSSLKKELGV